MPWLACRTHLACLLALVAVLLLANVPPALSLERQDHERWLAIVVPYRDRDEHLRDFLQSAVPYVHTQVAHVRVFVVRQEFGEKFNRGLLLNIGFVLAAHRGFEYFAFHDVDMIPIAGNATLGGPLYTYVSNPTHLATAAQQFGWQLPYDTYVGGVLLMNTETILKTNGFPNRYWGWGGEDDEMWWRFQRCNLTLERYPLESGRYTSLRHKKAHGGVEMMRNHKFGQAEEMWLVDGVNSVHERFHVTRIDEDDELHATTAHVDVWPGAYDFV